MNENIGTTIAIGLAFFLLTGFKTKTKFVTPVKGRISSRFGKRDDYFHKGVDIAVPVGTEIKSPLEGTVTRLFITSAGGKQMVIKHPDGFVSGYAHLSKFLFGAGAKVSKGRVIALSGRTGDVTGPHLHFAWQKNGEYKNPERFFDF